MTKDEEFNRYMMIVEQCKEQMNQLEMQSQYLQAAVMDYNKAKITIEKLNEIEKDTNMLIPLGGGTFIDATAKKQSKILLSVIMLLFVWHSTPVVNKMSSILITEKPLKFTQSATIDIA